MGGPVKALREASLQARYHFTQADRVNRLVGPVKRTLTAGLGCRVTLTDLKEKRYELRDTNKNMDGYEPGGNNG